MKKRQKRNGRASAAEPLGGAPVVSVLPLCFFCILSLMPRIILRRRLCRSALLSPMPVTCLLSNILILFSCIISPSCLFRIFIIALYHKRYVYSSTLICLGHFLYRVFVNLPHIATIVPATKIVIEEQFSLFYAYAAHDVLIHDVREEVLRKIARIHQLFTRLFQILEQIFYRVCHAGAILELLKIIPSELLSEIGRFQRRLHTLIGSAETLHLGKLAGDLPRYLEYSVKVQPIRFGRAFPHSYISPAFP